MTPEVQSISLLIVDARAEKKNSQGVIIRSHPEMKKMTVPGGLACLRFGRFEQVKKRKICRMPPCCSSGCTARYVRQNTIHFHTISTSVSVCSTVSPMGTKQVTKSDEMPSLHPSGARGPRSSGGTQTPIRLSRDKNRTAQTCTVAQPASPFARLLTPNCCRLLRFSDAGGLLSTPRVSQQEPDESVSGAQLARRAHLPSNSSDKCFTS